MRRILLPERLVLAITLEMLSSPTFVIAVRILTEFKDITTRS